MPHPGFGRPDDAVGLLCRRPSPSSLATLVSRDCRLTPTRSGSIESSGLPGPAAADDLSGNPDDHRARRNLLTTTALAPIRLSSPILIAPRTLAPAPMVTRSPTVGWRLPVSRAGAAEGDAVDTA